MWLLLLAAKAVLTLERRGPSVLSQPVDLLHYTFRDAIVTLVWAGVVAVVLAAWRAGTRAEVGLRVALLACAAYVGVNIGFFRSFSTPLNRGLLDMAGGTFNFEDSASAFLTMQNLWPVALCITLAGVVPTFIPTLQGRRQALVAGGLAVSLVAVLVVAPLTDGPERPAGLDRNALWEAVLLPIPNGARGSVPVTLDVSQPIVHQSLSEPMAVGDELLDLVDAASGMNVVLVVLESTSASYLGVYGAEADPMPRVSALAAHSLVYDAWYAPVPTSMKCMFSYLCSTYPYPDAIAESQLAPRLPCQSLPEVLAAAGYRNTLVTSAKFSFNSKRSFLDDRGFESLWDADSLPAEPSLFRNNWGLAEEAALGQMRRFLDDQADDDRFFLTYVPIFPHHPYPLPPDEMPKFGLFSAFDEYRSALAYTDRIVGELVDTLRENGQLNNTLVVVIGDHGEPFGQHPGNNMHSNAIYEENVRVPVLVHNERLFPEQRRALSPADHTDLAPTLTDLLGVQGSSRWQGRSTLRGERDMARFFTDYSFLMLGLRDGRFKYIYDMANEKDELYDLTVDPYETASVAADHAELVAAYRQHVLHAYWRQIALFEDYDAYLAGTLSMADYTPLENVAPVYTQLGWGRLRPDLSVGVKPLNIAGQPYSDGLGTHANGTVRYDLAGRYDSLEGLVGRDYAAIDGVVAAEIWVDSVRVFESGPLTRDTAAVPFRVPLVGASTLELVILDGGDTRQGDHADWVDVRLR